MNGARSVSTVRSPGGDAWQTIDANADLLAGSHTLRVTCAAKGQSIHWLEFVRR